MIRVLRDTDTSGLERHTTLGELDFSQFLNMFGQPIDGRWILSTPDGTAVIYPDTEDVQSASSWHVDTDSQAAAAEVLDWMDLNKDRLAIDHNARNHA